MIDTGLVIHEIRLLRELIEQRFPKRKPPQTSSMQGKTKYGEFKKVALKDEEYQALLDKWGAESLMYGIKILDEYCESKGTTYRNCFLMLRDRWPAERMLQHRSEETNRRQRRSVWGE